MNADIKSSATADRCNGFRVLGLLKVFFYKTKSDRNPSEIKGNLISDLGSFSVEKDSSLILNLSEESIFRFEMIPKITVFKKIIALNWVIRQMVPPYSVEEGIILGAIFWEGSPLPF
ncbi:hypothetical protein [Cognataquiflexum rubidum]|uniref:hypothetical protein n=1 Tax=Cognataquiflexum rubidum TaxID=2922273 RepID=UPI001F13A07E|nr:hypothetical protein [Cognataquiflexum rubidum]MCH6234497.1 hypothetical protein [Cognataquiflexum rubidum]